MTMERMFKYTLGIIAYILNDKTGNFYSINKISRWSVWIILATANIK